MWSRLIAAAILIVEYPISRLRNYRTSRYILVGGLLFLVDLGIVYFLVRMGMNAGWAQLFGRGTGAALGFFMHRFFTFREKGVTWSLSLGAQSAGYLLVTAMTFLSSPFILLACLHLTEGELIYAKLIAEAVMVCMTYIALNMVFRGRGERGQNG